MKRTGDLFRSLSSAVVADATVLLISVVVTLVVPRYVGVAEYGYWQLYLFYGTYVQLAQLGWSDGLLVRKAGTDWRTISPRWFSMQLYLQVALVIAVASALGVFAVTLNAAEQRFIVGALCTSAVISNSRFMCLRLFQATRQMHLYSLNVVIDRIAYAALVLGLIAIGMREFKLLIVASLAARALALVVSLWMTREKLTAPDRPLREDLEEARGNVSSGVRTLLAVLAGAFMVGVVRLIAERAWDVTVFANISLGINIAGLVTVFVSGLSFALLPYLRRLSGLVAREIYAPTRALISGVLISCLLLYFPARIILSYWLPDYALGLDLLFLLFPIVVFDGRTSLLSVTYLRAARRESALLWVNVAALGFSAVCAGISAFVVQNLPLTVGIILLSVALRSIVLELILMRALNIGSLFPIMTELAVVVCFVAVSGALETLPAVGVYSAVALAFLIGSRTDFAHGVGILRQAITK